MNKVWFKILKYIDQLCRIILTVILFTPTIILGIILVPIIIPWNCLNKYITQTEAKIQQGIVEFNTQ